MYWYNLHVIDPKEGLDQNQLQGSATTLGFHPILLLSDNKSASISFAPFDLKSHQVCKSV